MGTVTLRVGDKGELMATQHQTYWLAVQLRIETHDTMNSVEFAPYTETAIGTVLCDVPVEFRVQADNEIFVHHQAPGPINIVIAINGDEPVTLEDIVSGAMIGIAACHPTRRLVIKQEA